MDVIDALGLAADLVRAGARRVYLGSRGDVARAVHVLLDGRPLAARAAGRD